MAPVQASYRLCPRCGRAVSTTTPEVFCINDGERLLATCVRCQAKITSPYAQFCAVCGHTHLREKLVPDQEVSVAPRQKRMD